jgi:hypothetical protein
MVGVGQDVNRFLFLVSTLPTVMLFRGAAARLQAATRSRQEAGHDVGRSPPAAIPAALPPPATRAIFSLALAVRLP